MQISCVPIQKEILQQIVSETGISNKKQQQMLKNQLEKKVHKHVNVIQYNQLREDRFVMSQKKVIEKQHVSLQKTKQYIQLRQDQATHNKNQSMIEKSKRVQSDLSRWEKIVQKNKEHHQNKLKESLHLIKEWNQKLSESSSRKSLKLYNVSKTLQQRSNQKTTKVLTYRQQAEQMRNSKLKNPETDQTAARYSRNIEAKKRSRVSTQSMQLKTKKNEEDVLQKYLMKTGLKNEKINQARYMKHYLLQKKQKILQEKEDNLKKTRQHRLSQIKHQLDERNQTLDQKFKSDRIKARNKKSSLPLVSGSKAGSILFENGPVYRSKKHSLYNPLSPSQKVQPHDQEELQIPKDYSPNYNRIIVEKLRNVALLVRKGKKYD